MRVVDRKQEASTSKGVAMLLLAAFALLAGAAVIEPVAAVAADWPMWRCDAGRTGVSSEQLAKQLHVQWVREYPPLEPAFGQARQERVQFDGGYEPIVAGKALVVASSRNDRVTALDIETGGEKWRFYADGPVRLAPVANGGRVYFSSDDGCLYCLELETGKLVWKVAGAPSSRKVLGNGRLISAWPARGGPVVSEGRVYFAAGVWPFEGIFIHACDAQSGKSIWINDRTGSLYIQHPHAAMSFGGPSPQGYLLVQNGRLVVPSSRAFPAFFDLASGKLNAFDFGHGGHGSRPGSWFVTSDSSGQLLIDPEINTETHDVGIQVIGQSGAKRKSGEALPETVTIGPETYRLKPAVASTIAVGGREFHFDSIPHVGAVHTALAADGKLFCTTRTGHIYCLGPKAEEPRKHPLAIAPLERPADAWHDKAQTILRLAGRDRGYALVWGLKTGRLAEEVAMQSAMDVIGVGPSAQQIDALRRRLDAAGIYGARITAHTGDPLKFGFPPYLADLIVCEDLEAAGFATGEDFLQAAVRTLRPYGGTLCLEVAQAEDAKIAGWLKPAEFAGVECKREGQFLRVRRVGPPAGAANYTGLANDDELVRAPLGLLWFGDTGHHHKLFYKGFTHEAGRGLPQTIQVVDGVMKYAIADELHGPNPTSLSYFNYLEQLNKEKAYRDIHVDVYTGRLLESHEAASQHPSGKPAAEASASDVLLARRNPITGIDEAREFLKGHGCDQYPADYGNLLTMRSGTAAFYDKQSESGTINISGTRSGCRNNLVPACGVLNVPSWTGNCTCNYPVFTSLALAPMPEEYEQWTAWGGLAVEGPIERVGINFGAPGDRMSKDGTLWLDEPSVGGPSPKVSVEVNPEAKPFYRHALRTHGGEGLPWVFASGIEDARSIRIETVARRSSPSGNTFSVRWTGMLEAPTTDTYTLFTRSGRGMRVFVDDRLLLDNTRNRSGKVTDEISAKLDLTAGQKCSLRVESFDRPGKGVERGEIELSWSSDSVPKQVVPAERLFAPDGRTPGLAGAYYDNAQFQGPAAFAIDPQIRFDWTNDLPKPIELCRRPGKPVQRSYTVRLTFSEPQEIEPGRRLFSVSIQGQKVLERLDVRKETGGSHRGLVREFRGIRANDVIHIELAPLGDLPPVLCGVELIAEDGERASAEGDSVLLFSYFRGNGEDGLHLATSRDGYRWTPLKQDRSFLTPKVGNKLMRDPCLLQGPDGMLHMVWTTGWGDRVIGYASSRDLIEWSPQQAIPVMSHEPAARNAWAPELFYDENQKRFLIFWASTIPDRFPQTDRTGDDGWNHRIYATSTADFKTFAPTRLFFDDGFNVIDATILKVRGEHYLIVKDETKNPVKKNLRIARSAKAEGPYRETSDPISISWVEGPSAVRIGDEFLIYFDHYTAPQYYGALRSKDLVNWEDISSKTQFPKGARHGTVVRVPEEVVAKLQ